MLNQLKSPMIEQAKKAAFLPPAGVQCLIFFGIFIQAQMIQSYFVIIPMMNQLLRSPLWQQLVHRGTLTFDANTIAETVQLMLSSPSVLLTLLLSDIVLIAIVLLYSLTVEGRNLASLGIRRAKAVSHYVIGMLLGLVFLAMVFGPLYLFGYVESTTYNGFHWLIPVMMIGFIIAAFAEEVLVRGYLMNSMAARWSLSGSILLSSFIFALLHVLNPGVNWLALVNIMLYGIIFSLLSLVADDIIMASGMHFFWNFGLGCLLGGNVSGLGSPSLFTVNLRQTSTLVGNSFGIEGDLFTTISGVLIGCVLLLILMRRIRKQRRLHEIGE